jgi:CDP-paratose 2-epimerase
MKVLVTGGCGFLGSHIIEYFRNLGWDTISYDNLTKYELEKTGFKVEEAREHNLRYIESIGAVNKIIDISKKEQLKNEKFDFIIHTAAQPAMTLSVLDSKLDFNTNVVGTINMLEMAKELKIPIVNCASVHVYGNELNNSIIAKNDHYERKPDGISEETPICTGTLTPLHASKTAADIYTKVYSDTYRVRAASFRLSGIYGERQFGGEDHGWVANFTIRTIMNKEINIFGNGLQTRDIVYAKDVADACYKFYCSNASGIYNIGGGIKTKISLIQAMKIIGDISNIKPIIKFCDDRHGDLRYFVCNVEKAYKEFNWEPVTMPNEGIQKLYKWVKENKSIFNGS